MRRDLRQTLHSAYSLVRSIEANKAASSITLDHLIQEQLDAITGGTQRPLIDVQGNTIGNRISKVDRLSKLQSNLQAVIDAVNAVIDNPDALDAMGIREGEE